MAKMYGVEIRSIKTFTGHEGECVQGDVYYNGEKLGFWSQDSWGGPDWFDFDERLLDKAVVKYKASLPKGHIMAGLMDTALFLDEIVQLNYIESQFKDWAKKGCHTTVRVDDGINYHLGAFDYTDKKDIQKYIKKVAGKIKNPTITFYRTLDDFIIE